MASIRSKSKAARHERCLAERLVQEKQTDLDHGKRLLQGSRASCMAVRREINLSVFSQWIQYFRKFKSGTGETFSNVLLMTCSEIPSQSLK